MSMARWATLQIQRGVMAPRVLVPPAASILVLAVTGLPARIAARTPIIEALRYE